MVSVSRVVHEDHRVTLVRFEDQELILFPQPPKDKLFVRGKIGGRLSSSTSTYKRLVFLWYPLSREGKGSKGCVCKYNGL